MIIMIDAGHGYATAGKRSPDGMREYEFNRAAADSLRSCLSAYKNVTLLYAHSDSADVPLESRTDKARKAGAGLYISIHANAAGNGGWHSACGIETYCYLTKPHPAYQLAGRIQKQLVSASGRRDRGVKTADFHVLRKTHCPAILVECGFMTNKEEAALLKTAAYRSLCGQAIGRAVAGYYGLQKKTG